jgi:predicted lipoprotein with Yx(FWY)xxD motif
MRRGVLLSAVGIGVIASACGSSGGASQASATRAATVSARSISRGMYLADDTGKTVYLFEADTSDQSTCFDDCAQMWPPLLTKGAPIAIDGASASELGTTSRRDGTTQVTYHGHPLYYYIADGNAGDINGEGLDCFGGVWYVVSPAGSAVK